MTERDGSGTPIEGYFEAQGVRLRYLDWPGADDARALLVIPGNGWVHSFSYLGGILQPGSRTVVLGVRGTNESAGAEPYTWETVIADIAEAVAGFGLSQPLAIIGGQGASAFALLYAAHHPDEVTHVVTLDYEIPTGAQGASGRRHRGTTWPNLDAAADEVLARWNVPHRLRAHAVDALRHFFVRHPDGTVQWPGGVYPGTLADLCEFYICEDELRPILRRVRCPVLTLWDSPVGERAAGIVGAEVPHREIRRIEGGKHLLQLSSPELVADAVRTWLTQA